MIIQKKQIAFSLSSGELNERLDEDDSDFDPNDYFSDSDDKLLPPPKPPMTSTPVDTGGLLPPPPPTAPTNTTADSEVGLHDLSFGHSPSDRTAVDIRELSVLISQFLKGCNKNKTSQFLKTHGITHTVTFDQVWEIIRSQITTIFNKSISAPRTLEKLLETLKENLSKIKNKEDETSLTPALKHLENTLSALTKHPTRTKAKKNEAEKIKFLHATVKQLWLNIGCYLAPTFKETTTIPVENGSTLLRVQSAILLSILNRLGNTDVLKSPTLPRRPSHTDILQRGKAVIRSGKESKLNPTAKEIPESLKIPLNMVFKYTYTIADETITVPVETCINSCGERGDFVTTLQSYVNICQDRYGLMNEFTDKEIGEMICHLIKGTSHPKFSELNTQQKLWLASFTTLIVGTESQRNRRNLIFVMIGINKLIDENLTFMDLFCDPKIYTPYEFKRNFLVKKLSALGFTNTQISTILNTLTSHDILRKHPTDDELLIFNNPDNLQEQIKTATKHIRIRKQGLKEEATKTLSKALKSIHITAEMFKKRHEYPPNPPKKSRRKAPKTDRFTCLPMVGLGAVRDSQQSNNRAGILVKEYTGASPSKNKAPKNPTLLERREEWLLKVWREDNALDPRDENEILSDELNKFYLPDPTISRPSASARAAQSQ